MTTRIHFNAQDPGCPHNNASKGATHSQYVKFFGSDISSVVTLPGLPGLSGGEDTKLFVSGTDSVSEWT